MEGRIFSAGKPKGVTMRAAKLVPCMDSAGQKIQSTSVRIRAALSVISSGSPGPTPTPQNVPTGFMIASRMMMVMVVSVGMSLTVLTNAADVVMMADLWLTDGMLEARQPHTVFAQLAVHVRTAVKRFLDALGEDFKQQRVNIEITCAEKLGFRMPLSKLGGQTTDAFFQYTGEQEKRKNNDACEPHAMTTRERFGQQRRRHTDVSGGRPAKAHAFPENPCQFADIRIGVGIAAAPADHQQQRVFALHRPCCCERLFNSQPAQFEDLGMQMQVSAVMEMDIGVFVPRFVDLAGNVVFGVTGGHEHPRQHGDSVSALGHTTLHSIGENGAGELHETMFNDPSWIGTTKLFHKAAKFLCTFRVTAAVSDK